MNELTQVNISNNNNNNQNLLWLQLFANPNLTYLQVDDPQAVIDGIIPPYNNWDIENDPLISDDCFLGLDDNLQTQISVYPNPVQANLHIDLPSNIIINKISVYDVLGKKVIETYGNQRQINLSGVAKGLLLVKIETNDGVVVKKIIFHLICLQNLILLILLPALRHLESHHYLK